MISVINSNCAGRWWSRWYLGGTELLLSPLDVTGRDDIMCHTPSTISLSQCGPSPDASRDGAKIRTIIVQTLHNIIKISGQAIYNATACLIQRSNFVNLIKWIWLSTCTYISHSSHVVSIRQVSRVRIIITDNVTQCSGDHRMTDHHPGSQDQDSLSPRRRREAAPDHSSNCNSSVCIFLLSWSEAMLSAPSSVHNWGPPGRAVEEDAEWTSVTGHWITIKTLRLHVIPLTPIPPAWHYGHISDNSTSWPLIFNVNQASSLIL